MPSRTYPTNTLDQASTVLAACKQIDSALMVGATSQAAFSNQIAEAQSVQAQIAELELRLIELRNRRDEQIAGIWQVVKRARATVKGIYGDDSSEYEIVGGTRMSERRKAMRRAGSGTPPA